MSRWRTGGCSLPVGQLGGLKGAVGIACCLLGPAVLVLLWAHGGQPDLEDFFGFGPWRDRSLLFRGQFGPTTARRHRYAMTHALARPTSEMPNSLPICVLGLAQTSARRADRYFEPR